MTQLQSVISPEVLRSDAVRGPVEEANRWLEEVVGVSTGPVKAYWDLTTDGSGRLLILLRLSDFTTPDGVTKAFAPPEFANRTHMERRLYGQLGDLLQARTRKLLRELSASTTAE